MNKGFVAPIALLLIIVLGFIGFWFYKNYSAGSKDDKTDQNSVTQVPLTNNSLANPDTEPVTNINNNKDIPVVSIIAQGLDTPWALTFLPGGGMLVTERKGTVRLVDSGGNLKNEPVATIAGVREISEGGLQGIVIHPKFEENKFVYTYYTYSGGESGTLNRVSRFTYANEKLTGEEILVDKIPGAANHDGGRVKFGPDGYLYVTTGDAQNPSFAQSTDSLAGKILRLKDDGTPAPGNPYGNRTFSYGHRNPQGITWDRNGSLWSTEHGPSGLETGNDEVNLIEVGKNYGWPDIRGTQTKSGMVAPVIESGKGNTWAPAGIAYLNGRFFFAGLRGSALYELDSQGKNLKTHFRGEYGRLREVVAGPDGLLYITTSNNDGRGTPKSGDDKILRINPEKL